MLRYGAERLLYRLCQSPHRDRFVLKGALLLLLWPDQLYRPTRDIDLEGFGDSTPEHLREVFREICRQPCIDDALQFDEASVSAAEIRAAHEYGGVRITLTASLAKAQLRLQVDIGFGDVITPAPSELDFPTLLPLPAPRLRTYPLETVVAEKFEAIVRNGRGNSRMKDFRDLTTFARRREFEGELLGRAVMATFARRNTDLADLGEVFDPSFYDDEGLNQRWRAYCRTTGIEPEEFADIGHELRSFLQPLADAIGGKAVLSRWVPRVGWGP